MTIRKGNRVDRALTREGMAKIMQQVCPSDAEQDEELERLLHRMDEADERRAARMRGER